MADFLRSAYKLRDMMVWLSRINHCRGFGVQSPSAYRFIRYVVNEHYPYYAYADLRREYGRQNIIDEKLYRLYLRLTNHLQPRTYINIGTPDNVLASYVKAGCRAASHIQCRPEATEDIAQALADGGRLVVRVSLRDCHNKLPMGLIDGMKTSDVLVVEDIKKGKQARCLWRQLETDSRTSVTFDLYYCGIVFFDERIKQNYKVNF